MKKLFVLLFIISLGIVFYSCSQKSSNLISPNTNSVKTLSKEGWYYSSEENWPLYIKDLGYGYSVELSESDYHFGLFYYGYHCVDFDFHFYMSGNEYIAPQNYTFQVLVNGNLQSQDTWSSGNYFWGQKPEGWSDWIDFNYNGISMSYRYYTDIVTYENAVYYDLKQNRIIKVQVKVLDYVAPDAPTGFSVSPSDQNGTIQPVTLTWNASSDPDVTGYEIYRQRINLSNGQATYSNFILTKTIDYRTTSSWTDNPSWRSSIIGYRYRMRAVSSTTNYNSTFTTTLHSYLAEYEYLLE